MITIRKARENEYDKVLSFYYELIDLMQHEEYTPGWKKGIYPADDYIKESIRKGELYIGLIDESIYAAMIVNHEYNEGYEKIKWLIETTKEETLIIHALGVISTMKNKGLAKELVEYVINLAKENRIKNIRLDVLEGNIPAEKLYTKKGFTYITTTPMYYEDTGWVNYMLYEYLL